VSPAPRSLQSISPQRLARFKSPDIADPLVRDAELAKIPDAATISGMFLMPMAAEAERLGRPLRSARPRYVRFNFYPLREHVQLMFEAAEAFMPQLPTRKAIRKLGRGAASALLQSTLGKVVLASAVSPLETLEAMAKAYAINLRPGEANVIEHGDGFAIVELREIHYLIDSNHVGAMEGLLRPLGLKPEVLVHELGPGHAELLVTWPS
jgi:uncharacterized protein (TIGR02265 family)